jgi:ABC-type branched-subunit amino acid transport system substrate-binding protein
MWGPISPSDKDVREVYLLAPTRLEQSRMCFDYFANKGVTKVASLSQNNDIGVQSEDAMKRQAGIRNLQIAAAEKIDIQAPNLSAPILNVINSGAQGLLISLDSGSLGTALNLLHDGGYKGLICSDGGSAGVGSLSNVGAANPDAATGFLAAMQTALPESNDPAVKEWLKLRESYNGRFKGGAANYSLQSYLYTMAFAELIHRLEGDYTRENFHKVAEGLKNKPMKLSAMPEVECGPLPGGHTCSTGAGLAVFDGGTKKWTQIEDFKRPMN